MLKLIIRTATVVVGHVKTSRVDGGFEEANSVLLAHGSRGTFCTLTLPTQGVKLPSSAWVTLMSRD
jgi:hypothetical protein